jgi:hypothetical protein
VLKAVAELLPLTSCAAKPDVARLVVIVVVALLAPLLLGLGKFLL